MICTHISHFFLLLFFLRQPSLFSKNSPFYRNSGHSLPTGCVFFSRPLQRSRLKKCIWNAMDWWVRRSKRTGWICFCRRWGENYADNDSRVSCAPFTYWHKIHTYMFQRGPVSICMHKGRASPFPSWRQGSEQWVAFGTNTTSNEGRFAVGSDCDIHAEQSGKFDEDCKRTTGRKGKNRRKWYNMI